MDCSSHELRRKWREGVLTGFAFGIGVCLLPYAYVHRPKPFRNVVHPAPQTNANIEHPQKEHFHDSAMSAR